MHSDNDILVSDSINMSTPYNKTKKEVLPGLVFDLFDNLVFRASTLDYCCIYLITSNIWLRVN